MVVDDDDGVEVDVGVDEVEEELEDDISFFVQVLKQHSYKR
jgi:hypothetical protein